MTTLERISDYLQKGRSAKVQEAVQQALEEKIPPRIIMEKGLLDGMRVVANLFKLDEVFVPQVLVASRAINAGLQILKPYLLEDSSESPGIIVIGTVKGDMHDIGKNIVRIMMESKGLKVVDLGVDVSAEQFFSAAVENNADIVCCSALLTATMEEMRHVVELFSEKNYRDKVKIMVGGAPVTQRFCDHIGADIYTDDAVEAATVAFDLCVKKVS
ncbi:methyltransferase cognate corrinoid proteins [Sporobacter termitidis DSM 10068]|uniref:Methyltransferase cognate corrinoid proteins n=1 Tax=Sporobacter termitidis DSM 10068 TaxID=1123282 RepID=A0A1M5TCW1_9FIRM|nr:corrinoid protein [Sporobacter termitidis]SHH48562.1 methyltransferase cognate corrinoid proteins [Sporobacter termitidis DSM 10068]